MTWQCLIGPRSHASPSKPPSKQVLRDQRVWAGLSTFVGGSKCDCADSTCSATRAARDWCREKGPECFDEILTRAPRGYVILRANPLRFERVDDLLLADGSVRTYLRNQLLVRVESGKEQLIVTPLGRDAGLAPLRGQLRVEVPSSGASVAIDGVNYSCAGLSDNRTGFSYDPPATPAPPGRWR